MNLIQRLTSVILSLALAAAVGVAAWWLITHKPAAPSADKPAPAATVPRVVKEEELNTLTLTEEAVKRIGLRVGSVEQKAVPRVRVYGGEVTIPAGKAVVVAAPLAGTLQAPPDGMPGAAPVRAGQAVFQLLPLLTPEGRATMAASLVDAEGQVNNARTQADLARTALERAQRVLREGAGSQRSVDEAQGGFDLATKTLEAAKARRATLARVIGEGENGTPTPLRIDAPEGGLLRAVSALPGQTVPSGASLFEVINLSVVWVRVPLPVDDLDEIDRAGSAGVGKLSAPPGSPRTAARPVAAPPSANALASTVDLYYEVPNTGGALAPGQRLGVAVPLAGDTDGLTVPWSAVVFDIHGGTWVYEATGPRNFVRRRVAVRHAAGADAALSAGPSAGTAVVVAGAQQLFGAETGFIK